MIKIDPAALSRAEASLLDTCRLCPMPDRLDLHAPERLVQEPSRIVAFYSCDCGHQWQRGYADGSACG